jgi:hypothetical protein
MAFASTSTNLGDGDADAIEDVHVRDLAAGTTRLVSAVPAGPKGNAASSWPTISADGAVVAFASSASTLVPDGVHHVLVRDLGRGLLTIADRAGGAGGALADQYANDASISADGRSVVWTSPATNLVAGVASQATQAYVRDLAGHTTRIVSRAGGAAGAPVKNDASAPALSADGACAVFVTSAALAPGAGTDFQQVYMRALKPGCVPALPAAAGGSRGGTAAQDLIAPVLSRPSLSRKRFAVGRKPKRGTVLRFSLSEPARVKIRVRHARGSLARAKAVGAGKLRFSGRIGGKALRPGRHRMLVTATDAAGNRSRRVVLRFRIVRR